MTSEQGTAHHPSRLQLPDSPASLMVIVAMLCVLIMQSLGGSVSLDGSRVGSGAHSPALVRLAHCV